jgi:type II secretory pathway component PulM
MSELAFDENGEHFQVPAAVARWRTRRFANPGKPGGAQVVYGPDSLPLFLDVDTTAEEFREAVGEQPGRYRLDGVDAQGRVVGGVPPAYLMINGPAGAASAGGGYSAPPPANSAAEYAMVELARANGDSLRAVADRFGGICDALANVVRAVDGAGLPRRSPLGPLLVDHLDQGDDDDEGERDAAAPPPAQPTFVTVMGQMMQMVQMFVQMTGGATPARLGAVMGQVVETAKVVEAVATTTSAPGASPAANEQTNEGDDDTRVATSAKANGIHGTRVANGTHVIGGAQREPARTRPSSPGAGRMPPAGARGTSSGASATSASPAADPMVQFQQIMAALTPEEQEQVQYVITTLSVRDLMQWYEQLAGMTVADGVAKIRGELARVPRVPTEHAA